MDDIYEKRMADESISQFWKHLGFEKIPIDDDEEDQTKGNETVQPRSNPRNSQDGRIQRKNHQTRYKLIKNIPKGRKNQFK